jgi:hypothetical protein
MTIGRSSAPPPNRHRRRMAADALRDDGSVRHPRGRTGEGGSNKDLLAKQVVRGEEPAVRDLVDTRSSRPAGPFPRRSGPADQNQLNWFPRHGGSSCRAGRCPGDSRRAVVASPWQ